MNLEPIFKEVQQRMFEKMDALDNHISNPNEMAATTDKLTFDNMATRSPFIKMVSNQVHPVTLMGGILNDLDGQLYNGYDMYSPRSYINENSATSTLIPNSEYILGGGTAEQNRALKAKMGADYSKQSGETSEVWNKRRKNAFDTGGTSEILTVNKSLKPIPGIKDIDVSFKGGTRAMREATVSWSCWDWEELDSLMPHFLAHGKTVLLEWGWVYGKDSIVKLPSLADTSGTILDDAYKDFSGAVKDGKGDFDAMVGVVKNFEFTTRADGGFDCQTIIASVGVNMFENPTPTSNALEQGTRHNISKQQELKTVYEKLLKATAGDDDNRDVLSLDAGVSLKLFISKIDQYIGALLSKKKVFKNKINTSYNGNKKQIRYISDKFIATGDASDTWKRGGRALDNVWVQWGWFEDNVLNKFLGTTNTKGESIINFKSVENTTNESGFSMVENVRIRNHGHLETTDINNHILPNQFYPMTPTKFEYNNAKFTSDGDITYLKKLAKIISEKFRPFAASQTVGKFFNWTADAKKAADKIAYSYNPNENQMIGFEVDNQTIEEPAALGEETIYPTNDNEKPGKYGYLRHILVNTKIIKEAFGVIDAADLGVESINIMETLDYMFDLLNQDLDIWNFQITTDSKVTSRTKIVDESISAFDFNSVDREGGIKTDHQSMTIDGKLSTGTVFYFPTWKSNSFVKSQNITAKIPNALQMTAMYGSSMNVVKESNNPGSGFSEKSGVAAGALYNDEVDVHNDGIDITFKNELYGNIKLGTDTSVVEFIQKNAHVLDEAYETRLTTIGKDIKSAAKLSVEQNLHDTQYDSSTPPPVPRQLTKDKLKEIFEFEKNDEQGGEALVASMFEGGKLSKRYNSKFQSGVDGAEGRLKPEFISSVKYLVSETTINRQHTQELIVPLDLDIEIDGTGGIYPGNSFNSLYIPVKYQKYTLFQAFDVSHKVDSSGWTTSISGKMRTTMKLVSDPIEPFSKVSMMVKNLGEEAIKEVKERAEEKELKKQEGDKALMNALDLYR